MLIQEVIASVNLALSRMAGAATRVVPAVAAALLVMAIIWSVAALVIRIGRTLFASTRDIPSRYLALQIGHALVWCIGFAVMLSAMGLDPQSVATGLGLTGVALGFALKDILSNLVSGVLILGLGFFKIGDQIVVGDNEGTVERIELRATHIRNYDGRLVLVPNAEIFTSRITNNTASPLRKAEIDIYIEYRQDIDRVLSLVLETIKHVDGVALNPAPSARVRDLTPEAIKIQAHVWTDSRRSDFMLTAANTRRAVLTALVAAGVELPNPRRRVVTMGATTAGVQPPQSSSPST